MSGDLIGGGWTGGSLAGGGWTGGLTTNNSDWNTA